MGADRTTTKAYARKPEQSGPALSTSDGRVPLVVFRLARLDAYDRTIEMLTYCLAPRAPVGQRVGAPSGVLRSDTPCLVRIGQFTDGAGNVHAMMPGPSFGLR